MWIHALLSFSCRQRWCLSGNKGVSWLVGLLEVAPVEYSADVHESEVVKYRDTIQEDMEFDKGPKNEVRRRRVLCLS